MGKLKNRDIYIVLGFLICMIIVGSIVDFQLSSAVYNQENLYGRIFCSYGESPMGLALAAAGGMLFFGRNKEKKGIAVLDCVLGILLLCLGLLVLIAMPWNYLRGFGISATPLIVCIAIVANALVFWFVGRLAKDADHKDVRRLAILFFAYVFLAILIINVIKIPWARPRMRFLAVNSEASFQPWWHPGYDLKDYFVAAGVASEEFKSFPSGHTADACTVLLFSLLPYLKKDFGKQRTIFWCGIVWTCLVAFSRIIMGAHFLTDVSFGFLISFLIFVCIWKIADKKSK